MSSPPNQTTASSTVQQSLRINTPTLTLKRSEHGHLSVLESLPEAQDTHVSVTETDSETGKPAVEFPRERDHHTVSKYRWRRSFAHSTRASRADIKQFDVRIDAEKHPDMAAWIDHMIDRISKLPMLDDAVSEVDTYDDLVSHSHLIREYEATYRLAKSVWSEDSLKSYAAEYTARPFRIKQFPQGFYTVPGPHHDTVTSILDDRLQDHNLGKYSVAWGGFIISPADFTAVHEHVTPAYHTPSDDSVLDRDTLARNE